MPSTLSKVFLMSFAAASLASGASKPDAPQSVPAQTSRPQTKSIPVISVPVFVYVSNGLPQCQFLKLPSGKAAPARDWVFPQLDCGNIDISGLKLTDFSLFEDGRKQKLQSAVWETWQITARDGPLRNQTWGHVESSVSSRGLWTSPEFAGRFQDNSEHLYLLSYLPDPELQTGGCHRIQIKVRRANVDVYATDQYCEAQTPSDLLNGTKEGKALETALSQKEAGKIPLYMQLGALHNGSSQQTRVDVVVKFPWNALLCSWDLNFKFHASIGILVKVFSPDGKLVTRFSDLLWPSWWPTYFRGWQQEYSDAYYLDEAEGHTSRLIQELHTNDPAWLPARYETQFDLPPGQYDLRIILSDGSKFGRAESSLTVARPDNKRLGLESVFLCKRVRDAHGAAIETAAANFAPQYVPLVSKGVRFLPAADTSFAPHEKLFAYFQIIDPGLARSPAEQIRSHLRIVDAKSGGVVKDFPAVDVTTYEQPGSTVIPIAREIPIDNLPKGQYRLEVQASDATTHSTGWREAEFTITDSGTASEN
jgi:hypothetical protein